MNELALTKGRAITMQEAFPFENEIAVWNYEEAVETLAPLVKKQKRDSAAVSKGLFIAHAALARRGGDRRSEDAPVYTWCGFCDAVGISRKTAALLMTLYDPVEDRVRDPEEIQAERARLLQEKNANDEAKLAAVMNGMPRPEDWTTELEMKLKERLKNQRIAEISHKYLDGKIRTKYTAKEDYFGMLIGKVGNASRWIRLDNESQELAQMEILETIVNFFLALNNPTVRMAAASNIGLKIREIINEMYAQDKAALEEQGGADA